MKNLIYLLVLGIAVPMASFNAQTYPSVFDKNNQFFSDKVTYVDDYLLRFRQSSEIWVEDVFTTYRTEAGLTANDTMVLVNTWQDPDTEVIYEEYDQYHDGLLVDDGTIIVGLIDCSDYFMQGRYTTGLNLNTVPTISLGTAEVNMIADFAVSSYETDGGELIIHNAGTASSSNYVLVYRFDLYSESPDHLNVTVLMDAHTGDIYNYESNIRNDQAPGLTKYYGIQDLDGELDGEWFALWATPPGPNVRTVNVREKSLAEPNLDLGDFLWNHDPWIKRHEDNSSWPEDEDIIPDTINVYSGQYTVSNAYQYFIDVHNRNGADGEGNHVHVNVNHHATGAATEFRDDSETQFIDFGVQSITSWDRLPTYATLDIAGHEFTHGIILRTCRLNMFNAESSALEESFCDIFGIACEQYGNVTTDFRIGEEVPNGANRNLKNPPSSTGTNSDSVDHYDDFSTSNNRYENGGIMNKWFSLLALGGTHHGITVQSIGFDKAIKITYRNMTNELTSNSQFINARAGAIAAATHLYGECSQEVISTTNAWAAVGLGGIADENNLYISGQTVFCEEELIPGWQISFDACGDGGASGGIYNWNYNGSWTVSENNGSIYITDFGNIPYYPYTQVISVTTPNGTTESITIKIKDCDGNEPAHPCDKYEDIYTTPFSNIRNIESDNAPGMEVYPNPANKFIYIKTPATKNTIFVRLYHLNGQLIINQKRNHEDVMKLNIDDVRNGLYMLEVLNGGKTYTEKVNIFKL